MNEVVLQCISGVCDLDIAHHSLGYIIVYKGVTFYDDDGPIAYIYRRWVHESLGDMVWLFEMVVFKTNAANKKYLCVVCARGFKWVVNMKAYYNYRL